MNTESLTVTLYFRQGSSDKVYQASLQPSGQGFIVTFAYGRRGGTLNTGTKTDEPVDYSAAKKIFDHLATVLPAGRVGTAEDIAHAVLFLVTTSFVTGTVLAVDGGLPHAPSL